VLAAADGLSGLRQLADHVLDLDVLVTDVEMPTLGGEALVRTIRHLGGERDLPILVVSGALDDPRTARLLAAGADACLEKRGGSAAVVDAARRLVAARRASEGLAPATPWARPLARIPLRRPGQG
jgi:CheY-like chemotaxis protein